MLNVRSDRCHICWLVASANTQIYSSGNYLLSSNKLVLQNMRVAHLLTTLAFPFLASASFGDQEVLSPPAMAQEPLQDSVFTPITTAKPSLTDLLTIESSASIYFSYARETAFSKEFSVVDNQLTLLVPTNKAVMALTRKPYVCLSRPSRHTLDDLHDDYRHQGTAEPEIEMSEEQYDKQSRRNVERWVAAHIIPVSTNLDLFSALTHATPVPCHVFRCPSDV